MSSRSGKPLKNSAKNPSQSPGTNHGAGPLPAYRDDRLSHRLRPHRVIASAAALVQSCVAQAVP